jgi:hypothetical protein
MLVGSRPFPKKYLCQGKIGLRSPSKFQEVIIWKKKANTPGLTLLSHSEQVKGEMTLKSWETNMGEGKKLSRDVKEACLEALSSINKNLIEL